MSTLAMADPAIVERKVGEQKAEITSTHPLALDAIWASISMHLTTNEWLRVARTCKASWGAQLPHVLLTEDTPVAGVLKSVAGVLSGRVRML